MPSTNKTPHGLNQWLPGDTPMMDDFNADNALIDALFDKMHPVGSIYMSVSNTNPGTIFGGTWEAWGAGRVPVGVDTSQAEFNVVEKMSGSKVETLTIAQLPTHATSTPTVTGTGSLVGLPDSSRVTGSGFSAISTNTIGSGAAHNNLQPYITCYMWKRTE